jgi:hypothetical protein
MIKKLVAQFVLLVGISMMAAGTSLAIEGRDDVEAGPIWNDKDAPGKCEEARKKHLDKLKKQYPAVETRWTRQWKTTVPGKKSVCGIRYIDRSKWQAKPLADRPLRPGENDMKCIKGNDNEITNGWKYDDKCRDKFDMNAEHLNHVIVVQGANSITKNDDGRYIFVLRKNDNQLAIRRYDRSDNMCSYRDYRYEKNHDNHVRHSQLNGTDGGKDAWEPVWSAGELWIKDGKIIAISNDSGHFRPLVQSLQYVMETLNYVSIPADKILRYDINKSSDKKALDALKQRCFGGQPLHDEI